VIPLLGLLPFAEKILDKVFPDPTQAAEAKIKLIEMQQSGELAKLANDAELFKAEVADRDSARKRESDIAVAEKAPMINKIIAPIMAISIVLLTFGLYGIVLFQDTLIDANKKDLVIYILGALTSICGQVCAYYFGSSASSQQKNSVIANLSK